MREHLIWLAWNTLLPWTFAAQASGTFIIERISPTEHAVGEILCGAYELPYFQREIPPVRFCDAVHRPACAVRSRLRYPVRVRALFTDVPKFPEKSREKANRRVTVVEMVQ